MVYRDDIHGEYRAPADIADFLLKVGGKNPHGEPLYRLVHSAARMRKVGGAWNDWADGLTVQQRGGLVGNEHGLLVPSHFVVDRTVFEVRSVRKYSAWQNCWILERWQPAHMYGTRVTWENIRLPEHPEVLLLGPYPEFGDYEYAAGPDNEPPSRAQLQEAIQHCEFLKHEHGACVEDNIAQAVYEAEQEYFRTREAEREETEKQALDALQVWNSTTPEAALHRQEVATRLGITSHAGN